MRTRNILFVEEPSKPLTAGRAARAGMVFALPTTLMTALTAWPEVVLPDDAHLKCMTPLDQRAAAVRAAGGGRIAGTAALTAQPAQVRATGTVGLPVDSESPDRSPRDQRATVQGGGSRGPISLSARSVTRTRTEARLQV